MVCGIADQRRKRDCVFSSTALHDLSFPVFGLPIVNCFLCGEREEQERWPWNEILEQNSKAAAQSWLNFSRTV